MGRRRQARELALQALYFIDARPGDPEEAMALFHRNFTPPRKARDFMDRLVEGVTAHREAIDAIVERYSENWQVFRMPRVDRNVIRIAVFEMFWQADIPFSVSINEAIDLGKQYGTDDSGAFINGILDRIRLALEGGELQTQCSRNTTTDHQETA
ncbi:MAG: transcription antitermination factor NusB [Desulfobacterales bacterium]|nr:transcription antitermination factor NusB [Desulfobacterales bacterium]MDJ0884923.1 transcription antitermination factor NusB [Desulfobacterales bacterium]